MVHEQLKKSSILVCLALENCRQTIVFICDPSFVASSLCMCDEPRPIGLVIGFAGVVRTLCVCVYIKSVQLPRLRPIAARYMVAAVRSRKNTSTPLGLDTARRTTENTAN